MRVEIRRTPEILREKWLQWKRGEISESLTIGLLLAAVGGFLDVYSFLARGEVFATAQTGNIVLLGLSFAEGRWGEALFYVYPILAFTLGILLAEAVKDFFVRTNVLHWRQVIIGFEAATLFAVALMPAELDVPANVCVSFVSSLQIQSFRRLRGNPYASTMCTGNLRSGTEAFYVFLKTREEGAREGSRGYLYITLAFILGVVIGAFVTEWFATRAVLGACALLVLIFVLLSGAEAGRKEIDHAV